MEIVEAPQLMVFARFQALPRSNLKYSFRFMILFSHVVTCVSIIISGRDTMDKWRERLKTLREEAGMKQGELSAKSGVARSQISMLETGTRAFTQKTIDPILEALGCTYNDLFANADTIVTLSNNNTENNQLDIIPDEWSLRGIVKFIEDNGSTVENEKFRAFGAIIKREIEAKKKQELQKSNMDKVLPKAA
jgi:transcriptional regulator with XRE-family HTH domain